ncbi:winged helix-turn-helix transcriptional regulator [Paracoccus benzoatiresistens]|uniref:Helix-turn-helix domain-containing protein n=1 Tax=Paracoccus benzoatiresistens TaxID=2997341 RepID=A0ABT4IZX9_9RHOB|nr:helix-turn-helix domain-containing protein [Paracoccus sp. EF6]MCZ0960426.1 helix-turn-helix domain-containing protein [Paracoccus sp. EF6]
MNEARQPPRIRYDEGCLAAHALNIMGDRWALLIVRELMLAPKRFQMIRHGLPGVTAAVLTQRLTQLIGAGVVTHSEAGLYDLTPSGRGLLPVLQAMCRWGALHPGHDPRRFISPTALILSMTAMIGPAEGHRATAVMQMGRESFVLRLSGDGILRPGAGMDPGADFVLSGSGNSLARAVYGPVPLARLAGDDLIGLSGDARAAQDFVDLFRLR